MLLSRDPSKWSKAMTSLAQARQWAVRLVCFFCGIALLLASPSHHHYRGLEVLVGVILLATALGDFALGILLAVAAREVKPRKLGTE